MSSVNSTELDIVIREVKDEFRKMLLKRKEFVVKLGNAFEKVVGDPESICEELKTVLREEIAVKLISARHIERYCPDKWKRKTKPRKPKNDILSFSMSQNEKRKEAIIDTQGNLVNGMSLEDYDDKTIVTSPAVDTADESKNYDNSCSSSLRSNYEPEVSNTKDFSDLQNLKQEINRLKEQREIEKNETSNIITKLELKVEQCASLVQVKERENQQLNEKLELLSQYLGYKRFALEALVDLNKNGIKDQDILIMHTWLKNVSLRAKSFP
jgi:hypothetical protein